MAIVFVFVLSLIALVHCETAFERKHVWKPSKTANQYIAEYGSNVPQLISLLPKKPDKKDYAIIRGGPKDAYRSINHVSVDTFYTKVILGETSYRCRKAASHAIVYFNRHDEPYHFQWGAVEEWRFLGDEYKKNTCHYMKNLGVKK